MDKYVKFKHILEYFVAHLEWIQNKDKSGVGYPQYIAPIVNKPSFRECGNGYNGDNIQNGISLWEKFDEGILCINVKDQFGQKNFKTRGCYLNWRTTGVNVIANWNSNHIASLEVINFVYWQNPQVWKQCDIKSSISSLGLFNGEESANSNLVTFFNSFCNLLKQNTVMAKNQTIIDTLYSNHNIILNGAPGTGKTFLAKSIAAQMISGNVYTSELESDDTFKTHCQFVQFHPSFDYTDFVEGLRPKKDEQDNIAFVRKNGIFKDFCEKAILSLRNGDKGIPYVFIIDEINRGEMSKIFGELFFSINPGYRGKEGMVKTQYQNLIEPGDTFYDGFYVPQNVYIIGTMNDIDRSVESMDFAMRRRFAFIEILAENNTSMLDDIKEKDLVIDRMKAINLLISSEDELGSSYHIGGAYFKKVELCRNDHNEIDWELFWERYLKRLVFEYVRGFQNRFILLEKMKNAVVLGKVENDNIA